MIPPLLQLVRAVPVPMRYRAARSLQTTRDHFVTNAVANMMYRVSKTYDQPPFSKVLPHGSVWLKFWVGLTGFIVNDIHSF